MGWNPARWSTRTVTILGTVLCVTAVLMVVWLSATARTYNCDQIGKAMNAQLDGLTEAAYPLETRTPEQDAAIAKAKAKVTARTAPILASCK